MKNILSENTLIPLSALALVFGAAMWLTKIFYTGEANAAQIVEIKSNQEKNMDKVYLKLDTIEEKIDQLRQKK